MNARIAPSPFLAMSTLMLHLVASSETKSAIVPSPSKNVLRGRRRIVSAPRPWLTGGDRRESSAGSLVRLFQPNEQVVLLAILAEMDEDRRFVLREVVNPRFDDD